MYLILLRPFKGTSDSTPSCFSKTNKALVKSMAEVTKLLCWNYRAFYWKGPFYLSFFW